MASKDVDLWKSLTVPRDIARPLLNQVIKKGTLEKRQRGRSNKDNKRRILKFQKRFLVLTGGHLLYYDNKKVRILCSSKYDFIQFILIG